MAILTLPFSLGKPSATEYATSADAVSYEEGSVQDALDNISGGGIKKLTQEEYDALTTKEDIIYITTDDTSILNIYRGTKALDYLTSEQIDDLFIAAVPSSDDVARKKWGTDWRMPTEDEFTELTTSANWTWYAANNTEFGGVAGYKVTSLISGYTDNYIFLPITGYYSTSGQSAATTQGNYWTSTRHELNAFNAYDISFTKSNKIITNSGRSQGMAVRPVTEVTPTNHDYVDLGLSVKWATCNVGAENCYDTGNYYSWGEYEPKDTYSWATYKFGFYDSLTKYNATDSKITLDLECDEESNKYALTAETYTKEEVDEKLRNVSGATILTQEEYDSQTHQEDVLYITISDTNIQNIYVGDYKLDYLTSDEINNKFYVDTFISDDAATTNWGSDWRMPTVSELGELLNDTDSEWYEAGNSEFNGVAGRKFTNKTDSSKYIFIPAAGYHENGEYWWENGGALLWSNELGSTNFPANASFTAFSQDSNYQDDNPRFYGYSIRPVTDNTPTNHDYVDLGVSVKWATTNLDAEQCYEYGGYYSWGETEPKETYTKLTYKYYDWSTASYTKYNADDGKTTLETTAVKTEKYALAANTYTKEEVDKLLESAEGATILTQDEYDALTEKQNILYITTNDNNIQNIYVGELKLDYETTDQIDSRFLQAKVIDDTATAIWGGTWRMPTQEEFMSLNDLTTTTSTTVNSVKVVKCSLEDGSYIIFPMCGYYTSSTGTWIGSNALYWSSSLYTPKPYSDAYSIFYSSSWNNGSYRGRCTGQPIRAVSDTEPTDGHPYLKIGDLYWATMNIGASSETDYGGYYAWGESETKDSYTLSEYKYYEDGEYTKYNANDEKTTLDHEQGQELKYALVENTYTKEEVSTKNTNTYNKAITYIDGELYTEGTETDDAAYYNWGGAWRIPTQDEVQDLIDNTTYSWETIDGITGGKYTIGDDYIFIPAAGYKTGSYTYSTGSYAYYWSSTIASSVKNAYLIQAISSSTSSTSTRTRDNGLPIRPVSDTEPTDGREYVKIGDLYWAKCNLGADSETEYGNYYSWGELYPKKTYSKSTYIYYAGSEYTKYNSTDGLTTLQKEFNGQVEVYARRIDVYSINEANVTFAKKTEIPTDYTTSEELDEAIHNNVTKTDDAARSRWGGTWRIPTITEWEALYNAAASITYEQDTRTYSVLTFESGDTLTIPLGGYRQGSSGYTNIGNNGYYLTNSLSVPPQDYSAMKGPYISNESAKFTTTFNRFYGFTARPVSDVEPTDDHAWVKVGNLYWATMNIGATAIDEYGDWIAWGESEAKSDYSRSTYKYYDTDTSSYTKYNTTDTKTELDVEYIDPENVYAELTDQNIGSKNQPVYIKDGIVVPCKYTIQEVSETPYSPDENTLYIITE